MFALLVSKYKAVFLFKESWKDVKYGRSLHLWVTFVMSRTDAHWGLKPIFGQLLNLTSINRFKLGRYLASIILDSRRVDKQELSLN